MNPDFSPNFSCSDPDLSHEVITEDVWMVESGGYHHISSVKVVAALQLIYLLIGIPWNVAVVLVIIKKKYYKDPTYVILLNMVMADLFICAFCLPFGIASSLSMNFNIGNSDYSRCASCQTITITTIILTDYSLFALALLSIDRLIYIRWPLKYEDIMNFRNIFFILVASALVCIVSSIPPVFGFGEIKFANPLGQCSLYIVGINRVTKNVYYLWVQILILSFPVSLALVANIWMIYIACSTTKQKFNRQRECNLSNLRKNIVNRQLSEQELKLQLKKQQLCLGQVFSIIFFVNMISWIPTLVILLISTSNKSELLSMQSFAFVYLVFLSQPVIHPILETCLVGKARWIFIKVVCYFRKKKVSQASPHHKQLTQFATSLELL